MRQSALGRALSEPEISVRRSCHAQAFVVVLTTKPSASVVPNAAAVTTARCALFFMEICLRRRRLRKISAAQFAIKSAAAEAILCALQRKR
ncbi:MAG: hypothetical protein HY244_09785 [Rhizobiales bacterium]|nr:hypothetical protein [Hyphomicrobiales bacterium]